MLHLSCASTHLTAFWGAAGGAAARFSVNNVHPIDDAGDLKVCNPVPYNHLLCTLWQLSDCRGGSRLLCELLRCGSYIHV